MAGIGEIIGNILERLNEWFRGKPAEAIRWQQELTRLATERAEIGDGLEDLKSHIRTLETRALKKKEELDRAHGDSRRIVVGEIERTFRELDGLREREQILGANMERNATARVRIQALLDALRQGMSEDRLEELALAREEAFDALRAKDRGVRNLGRQTYAPPDAQPVEVGERLDETAGKRESQPALSPDAAQRLAELQQAVQAAPPRREINDQTV